MQCAYCVHIVLQNTSAAIEVGCGFVRDGFGGMAWFKGGLSCKRWVNSVITCRYFFFLYKYNLQTCSQ